MFGLFNVIKMGGAAVLVVSILYYPIKLIGRSEGKAEVYAEIAAASVKVERERKKDDATTQNMDDFAVCVRDLKSRGLPVEVCEQLRRVQPQ